MLFPLLIKIMPLCKILEIEFSHKFIYRDDPLGFDLTHEALVYFCNRKGGCLFETGRLYFFIYLFFLRETADWDQSFEFYLTEDQRDWLTALLFLDPSVMKYFVSLWLASHLVTVTSEWFNLSFITRMYLKLRPISNLDATPSFVFVLNQLFVWFRIPKSY